MRLNPRSSACLGTLLCALSAACSSHSDPEAQANSALPDCLAVLDHSQCCPTVEAVSKQTYIENPCLLPSFVDPQLSTTLPADCFPANCDANACEPSPASSRVAAATAGDACILVDECTTTADCTLLTNDIGHCTCCEEAFPVDLSLSSEDDPRQAIEACLSQCAECVIPAPFCETQPSGLRLCVESDQTSEAILSETGQ